MNNFCRALTDALRSEFEIDVNIFVSINKENSAFITLLTLNFLSIF